MDCQEVQELLHPYVDGELDADRSLEIDRHIQQCPACARAQGALQALRSFVRAHAPYYSPPERLRDKVRWSLHESGPRGFLWRMRSLRWLGVAAALALAAVAGWELRSLRSSHEQELLDDVVAAHIRSQMPGHLTDVASSDQQTVKPFFKDKLDFSPPVRDFSAHGFSLVGGRLDYLDRRPVAALVYQHGRHLINVFMWPAGHAIEGGTATQQGYHVLHWDEAGLDCWVVSDLDPEVLGRFASLMEGEAQPAGGSRGGFGQTKWQGS